MQVKYSTVVVIARDGVLHVVYFRRHVERIVPSKLPIERSSMKIERKKKHLYIGREVISPELQLDTPLQ